MLRRFSQVATAILREGDLIARWGGEEFTIVLPGTNRQQAVAVLDRIRDSLAHSQSGAHPGFTISFGVTDTSCASSIEQLLQLADDGLYRSKQDGRDRVTVAERLSHDAIHRLATGDASHSYAGTNGHNGVHAHDPDELLGDGEVIDDGAAGGNGKPATATRRMKMPALHQASDEPEPRPTGREIR